MSPWYNMVLVDDRCLTYAVGKYGSECQPLRRLLPGAFQHQMQDPKLVIFHCQPLTFVLVPDQFNSVCMRRVRGACGNPWWSVVVVSVLGHRWVGLEEDNSWRCNLTYVMKWLMMTRSLPQTHGLNAYDLTFWSLIRQFANFRQGAATAIEIPPWVSATPSRGAGL